MAQATKDLQVKQRMTFSHPKIFLYGIIKVYFESQIGVQIWEKSRNIYYL